MYAEAQTFLGLPSTKIVTFEDLSLCIALFWFIA